MKNFIFFIILFSVPFFAFGQGQDTIPPVPKPSRPNITAGINIENFSGKTLLVPGMGSITITSVLVRSEDINLTSLAILSFKNEKGEKGGFKYSYSPSTGKVTYLNSSTKNSFPDGHEYLILRSILDPQWAKKENAKNK